MSLQTSQCRSCLSKLSRAAPHSLHWRGVKREGQGARGGRNAIYVCQRAALHLGSIGGHRARIQNSYTHHTLSPHTYIHTHTHTSFAFMLTEILSNDPLVELSIHYDSVLSLPVHPPLERWEKMSVIDLVLTGLPENEMKRASSSLVDESRCGGQL